MYSKPDGSRLETEKENPMCKSFYESSLWMLVLSAILILFSAASGEAQTDGADKLPDFDKLWNYGSPKATEEKFWAILKEVKFSDHPAYWLEVKTQIARTQGLQRKFDEAHATLDDVEIVISDEPTRVRVRYLLERGRVLNSSGRPEESKPYFLDALDNAQRAGEETLAVDAAHMMGIVEPPEKQIEWNLKAIEMAEMASDEKARRWLGTLYNNTGWSYHDLGQYGNAMELFKKALVYREKVGREQPIRIAKWAIGRCLRSLGKTDEALEIHRKLLAEYESVNRKNGYVFEELGECLLVQGKEDEAKSWFAQAYEELSKDQWHVANEPERIERVKKLGGVN